MDAMVQLRGHGWMLMSQMLAWFLGSGRARRGGGEQGWCCAVWRAIGLEVRAKKVERRVAKCVGGPAALGRMRVRWIPRAGRGLVGSGVWRCS